VKSPRSSLWTAFYRVVARIPRGKVATYGSVALIAGRPGYARHVGYALAALVGEKPRGLPWQRVLGSRPRMKAAVAIRDPIGAALQRVLLEEEGVEFDARARVDLERFGWLPRRR